MPLYRVRIEGTMPVGDIVNFGFWVDSASTTQAVANAGAAWLSDWMVALGSNWTTNLIYSNVSVGQYVSVTGSQQERADTGVTIAGTTDPVTSAPLPGDVAVVCSLKTDLANRRGRGRFYIAAPHVGTVGTTGRLGGAFNSALASALASAFTSQIQTIGQLVVASRTDNAARPVTRIEVGDLFDTMRSRENAAVESRAGFDL